ncbi:hypothetical protein TVAG_419850 [Trichomonas vaginalis G3]|uniref:Uncharacterized protein n=1 Tax=Trichomonas vaginalis (strain ATCC PRA-98 / G3) TaxID=412133 RepID=A2EIV9_TRIV3|nr:endonuclease protein [Trichomonas vaginalis G3]EAY07443.1 hypothetical protein TVAG_419850 [Trichomonas vaginalis G3]KAI5484653.1 endonuclease protein [Trichomonas vaginalis G3]|eukprot:XP_001319666.1 hypothetical protein [Trichomonas vaginalis G3]
MTMINEPIKYQNSMKIPLLVITKKNPQQNYIEFDDLTSENENNTITKDLFVPSCILKLNPGKRIEDYAFKNCTVEEFDFYIERNVTAKGSLMRNELFNYYNSVQNEINDNSQNIIIDFEDLEVKFGEKSIEDFYNVLKTFSQIEIIELDKQFQSYGKPSLSYDPNYQMKNSNEQFDLIRRKIQECFSLIRCKDQLQEKINGLETNLQKIKEYPITFDIIKAKSLSKTIDFENLKEEVLFSPNITVKGNQIISSFKSIDIG